MRISPVSQKIQLSESKEKDIYCLASRGQGKQAQHSQQAQAGAATTEQEIKETFVKAFSVCIEGKGTQLSKYLKINFRLLRGATQDKRSFYPYFYLSLFLPPFY